MGTISSRSIRVEENAGQAIRKFLFNVPNVLGVSHRKGVWMG
jgi:hypothetical protein